MGGPGSGRKKGKVSSTVKTRGGMIRVAKKGGNPFALVTHINGKKIGKPKRTKINGKWVENKYNA